MRKRFLLVILLAAFIGVSVALGLFSFARFPFGKGVFEYPQSFQANDFVGTWINLAPGDIKNPSVITYLFISNNQGTYTIDAHQIQYFYQYGSSQQRDYNFGTTTLTINPPNAHALSTFQQGSLDMRLQLLNQTSMQIVESLQSTYGGQTTTSQKTEHFAKVVRQTSSSTTSSAAANVIMDSYDWTRLEHLFSDAGHSR